MKHSSTLLRPWSGFLLFAIVAAAACSHHGGNEVTQIVAPTVRSSTPLDHSTGVPINTTMSIVFNERMDASTLNQTTFLVTSGPTATPVQGTVSYAGSTAVFTPSTALASNITHNVKVTRGARNFFGIALATDHDWDFTTSSIAQPAQPVPLGSAGGFAVLAKSGISSVPKSLITGNVGISPAAATAITGFSLSMNATNTFSTSPQVIGNVFAADYAVPTPVNLTTAISDMETAYGDAASRPPNTNELGAGAVGGLTVVPGVYKWGTGLLIATDVTLAGNATDVWVFQIAQGLTVTNGANVILTGGALPQNVFWAVAGVVDIGSTATLQGIVLARTSVSMRNGATVQGRVFAQTAVTMDAGTITQPAQ